MGEAVLLASTGSGVALERLRFSVAAFMVPAG